MPRKINIEKKDLPELEPWLTVEFYKTDNRAGFDFKIATDKLSTHQKDLIIQSENLICQWLKISENEFNKFLQKKLEEEYPLLREVHQKNEQETL